MSVKGWCRPPLGAPKGLGEFCSAPSVSRSQSGRGPFDYHFARNSPGSAPIDPVIHASGRREAQDASTPGADSIRTAAARIAAHIRRTPVIEVDGGDFGLAGVRLVLKLEFLQHAGSFKTRGAFNGLLSRTLPAAGVVAASGGNHGAAVAYAAMKLGVPATIFVPVVASPAKIAQIRGYGARLEVGG